MVDHQITLEDVRWAYRLLLDRDPESGEIVEDKLRRIRTRAELRRDFLVSSEFKKKP
jgi:hypothetical protein